MHAVTSEPTGTFHLGQRVVIYRDCLFGNIHDFDIVRDERVVGIIDDAPGINPCRFHVTFGELQGWFSDTQLEAYEAPALTYDDAADEALALMPELEDAIEYIERDSFVHVTPNNRNIRPFYGYVEVVNVEVQKALVRHVSGRLYPDAFTVEEMKLIYSAERVEENTETLELATEVEISSAS